MFLAGQTAKLLGDKWSWKLRFDGVSGCFVPATRFKFCWITGRHSGQSHRSGHLALLHHALLSPIPLSPIPLSPIRFQSFHSEWTRYGVSVVKRGASYRTRGRGGFPNTKLSPHWQVVRNLQGLFTA